MVQYLIAIWDYAAEGQFELSFKQGDRIKLLEKHNDDWWEGELNEEIGFFPANRIRLETEQDVHERTRGSEGTRAESAAYPSTDIFAAGDPASFSMTSTIKEHAVQADANSEHEVATQSMPAPPQLPPRNTSQKSASVQPQLPPRPSNDVASPPELPPRQAHSEFIEQQAMHDTSRLENKEATLVDVFNDDDHNKNDNGYPWQTPDDSVNLPAGWQYAYDNDGTIYYFNLQTGESRWDRPEASFDQTTQSDLLSPPLADTFDELDTSEKFQKLNPDDLKKLQLDQLHPEWIRLQGFVQMKMAAGKEDGGKLSSWKFYYAVLSNGFLLLYKDNYSKSKKYTKPLIPVGSFDLDSCQIEPASKNDTKRKHAFLITTPKKVTIYVQTANEKELAAWLDAIMRELIARKEGSAGEDSEILRLLKNLTIDSEQMKVNRKMSRKTSAKDGDEKDDQKGKPKSLGHWFGKPGKNSDKLPRQAVAGTTVQNSDNCVFGGFLTVEEEEAVPRIVRCCIEQVNARGIKSVGIYRLSGPASSIQKYRSAFNKGESVDLSQEPDINVVTGLLKLYFRELKNPLMTYEYYGWFIDAARIPDYDERMYRIKSIIHVLPEANYTVLEYLMRHLNYVAAYSDVNKMETSNLALIFSVGLLRSPQEDLSSIMHTDLQSKIIEAIIQQVDWFFEQDQDEEEPQALSQ